MTKVTLADVATEARVSLTTASMALAGKGRISSEVRERVVSIAMRLGYDGRSRRPAAHRRRGRYVGVLYNEERTYEWGFIRPIMIQCEEMLLESSYAPIVIPIRNTQSADAVCDTITYSGISGVLSIQYCEETVFRKLEDVGVPVVIVNNVSKGDVFYAVGVDDFQGAYEGARFLCELGHRKFVYVEYDRPDYPALITDRFIGFKKAIDEFGLTLPSRNRISIPFMDQAALTAELGTVLTAGDSPTAIFAHDDFLAAYVVSAARELGFSVPQQLSVIAPGDVLDYGHPWTPQITTMRINTALLGKIACNLLLDRLTKEDEDSDVHVLRLKQQLVKRASCRQLV